MASIWALSCGFSGILPFYYPVFFTIMILHRYFRDVERCKRKYGKDWDRYCEIVKYAFIPYVIWWNRKCFIKYEKNICFLIWVLDLNPFMYGINFIMSLSASQILKSHKEKSKTKNSLKPNFTTYNLHKGMNSSNFYGR